MATTSKWLSLPFSEKERPHFGQLSSPRARLVPSQSVEPSHQFSTSEEKNPPSEYWP